MALYTKQDFSPPVLSRRWFAMKFRPNMILHSHANIIAILESGLLFREDSIEVEQEAPGAEASRGAAGSGSWLTLGERVAGIVAVTACVLAWPPRNLHRSTIIRITAYMCIPVVLRTYHRLSCRGALSDLLSCMRDYIALARRAAACLKECSALRGQLGSVTSITESLHTLLCRQQASLSSTVARASSALLGNAPWLRGDVAWDAVYDSQPQYNLMRIHHAFLVIQSTFLKHIAMAHYIPSVQARRLYKNHNERLYWIHTTLLPHITEEFKENHEALTRMYRLLKNYSTSDVSVKTPGTAIVDNWFYSDVHSGIARASLELKTTLNKCHDLDTFLDACAVNNQDIDLDVLNKDIEELLDSLMNALKTVQNSQIRLKKISYKQTETKEKVDDIVVENDGSILKIEDKEPESKDEVFYFVNTGEEELVAQPNVDVTTAPGKKEKDATKIVLNELKRKLVKREDVMRERERQALKKTMPELKETPEFPRQLNDAERSGFIKKIRQNNCKKTKLRNRKIEHKNTGFKTNKYSIERRRFTKEDDIKTDHYKANAISRYKNNIFTIDRNKNTIVVTKWLKAAPLADKPEQFSDLSDGLSDVEAGAVNKTVHEAENTNGVKKNYNYNYKFSKKEMELTPSSDSDSESYGVKNRELLHDVRRHRAVRKKNYPVKRASVPKDDQDEGMQPWRPALGAGLALAAVLRGVNSVDLPEERGAELFIGQGQLSEDSGHTDSE